jgi:hypothetical protein
MGARGAPGRAYLASCLETAQGESTLPMLTCVLRVRAADQSTS